MTYQVVHSRNVGPDREPVVMRETRRYNGAVNERDALVDSAREVAIKHAGGLRVVVGPTSVEGAVAVITVLADRLLIETYAVRHKARD